jgi:hypothetical protein
LLDIGYQLLPTGEMIKRLPLSDRTPIAMVARIKDPTARELMELALAARGISQFFLSEHVT